MPLKVIIVGAGICGLTAAVALRRAGHDVEIFERSGFANPIGGAVSIQPNGSRALGSLGFSFTRARAVEGKAWESVDGASLHTFHSVDLVKASMMFKAKGYAIHRVDLQAELLRLATSTEVDGESLGGTPVKLNLGAKVTGGSPDGSIVLEDGSSHTADLIVAADGLHSVLRDTVLGPDPANKPHPSGMGTFRYLVETDTIKQHPDLEDVLAKAKDKAMMIVDTKETVGERHIIWYACRDGETQNFGGLHTTDKLDTLEGEAAKQEMLKEYGHFHKDILKIVEIADHVKMWPLFIHKPYPTWVNGKVVMIGDAAHPMLPLSGQGANQAIEDGAALGLLFAGVNDASQIPKRLELFQKVRKNRASRIQTVSKVRAGREKEVEQEVAEYLDEYCKAPPQNQQERVFHDYSSDLVAICNKVLGEVNGV